MLTQGMVHERLAYDPQTGEFAWKKHAYRNRVGKVATTNCCQSGRSFKKIAIGGKQYLAHRIAWLYCYGAAPKGIDHKNGDASDNRIANLREANQSQNIANAKPRKDCKLGIRGVSRRRGKYRVAFHKNGKQVHVGDFDTIEEAHSAAAQASIRIHGEFSLYARSRFAAVQP